MTEQSQGVSFTFDIAAFRSWLSARRLVVVGRSAAPYECPLARFLLDTIGQPYGVYLDDYSPLSQPLETVPLPEWAQAFALSLDFTYPLGEITGEQALVLLSDTHVNLPINDEFCWMHTPGGWTCTECRQPEQADPMQLVTREGLYA